MNLYDIHPDCIRTITGKDFNVFEPNPDLIDIEDIAHALSNQCRWGGHLPKFYSVAQHSLNCAHRATEPFKLQALLHDASEAYLLDIPTPIKRKLANYAEIEDGLMRAISQKFGFPWPTCDTVRAIDKAVLEWEWENLKLGGNPDYAIMSSEDAKRTFLWRFNQISAI